MNQSGYTVSVKTALKSFVTHLKPVHVYFGSLHFSTFAIILLTGQGFRFNIQVQN